MILAIALLFRYIFDDVIRWKYDVICKIFFIFLFSLQVEVWFSPVSVLIVCKSTLLHSYAPSCTNHVIQVMPEELNYIVGNIYKINNKQNNSVYQGLRVIPMHISDNLRNSAFIAFKLHWINCCKNDFCCFTRKLALIVHYNLHCLSFSQNVQKMEYSVNFAWHAILISEFKQGLITFNILEFQQKSQLWEQ